MNTNITWFSKDDIKIFKPINVYNLHGVVLPHAGTKFSGEILSHTLRYRPKKSFENIVIFYLPASELPDVGNEYHEYVVPQQTMKLIFPDVNYVGYNMLSSQNPSLEDYNLKNTFFVISADFSHFLPFSEAIEKENCGTKSLMFRTYNTDCSNVVDHKKTFKFFFKKFPKLVLDWVGRTRSPGEKGVGYLSFLIRSPIKLSKLKNKPDGFFVTAYDKKMVSRECLGDLEGWSKEREQTKVREVLDKAQKTSRLTGGRGLNVPVKYYQVTYLFKQKTKQFIRGWHSILGEAFYLSDVFLENTFEDGRWIGDEQEWNTTSYTFDLGETFKKLHSKRLGLSGGSESNNLQKDYTLFTSENVFRKAKKGELSSNEEVSSIKLTTKHSKKRLPKKAKKTKKN